MKTYILTICSIFLVSISFSQTVFWTENFGSGCNQGQSVNGFPGSTGNWVLTYLIPPFPGGNTFYVSSTEAGMGTGMCGKGCLSAPSLTNQTLHVSVSTNSFICTTGDCGAIYDAAIAADLRAESPTINCVGKYGLSLSFEYLELGDGVMDDGTIYYSIGLGPWTLLGNPAKTACANGACTGTSVCNGFNEGVWGSYTVNLPASVNNVANLRLGFRWANNNDNNGTDPSFAIDNIAVSAASITAVPETATNTNSFKVYPNPSKDILNIETEHHSQATIEVLDALGRILIREEVMFKKESLHKINIGQLVNGIYFVRINSGDKRSAPVKIIKE